MLTKNTEVVHVAKYFWNNPSGSSMLRQAIVFPKGLCLSHVSCLPSHAIYCFLQTSQNILRWELKHYSGMNQKFRLPMSMVKSKIECLLVIWDNTNHQICGSLQPTPQGLVLLMADNSVFSYSCWVPSISKKTLVIEEYSRRSNKLWAMVHILWIPNGRGGRVPLCLVQLQ